MNKEDFIKAIASLEMQLDNDLKYCRILADLLHPYIEPYDNHLLFDTILDLIDVVYPGSREDVDYFMYELEFGKNHTLGKMRIDGNPIDFGSADKLWEYLEKYKNN